MTTINKEKYLSKLFIGIIMSYSVVFDLFLSGDPSEIIVIISFIIKFSGWVLGIPLIIKSLILITTPAKKLSTFDKKDRYIQTVIPAHLITIIIGFIFLLIEIFVFGSLSCPLFSYESCTSHVGYLFYDFIWLVPLSLSMVVVSSARYFFLVKKYY